MRLRNPIILSWAGLCGILIILYLFCTWGPVSTINFFYTTLFASYETPTSLPVSHNLSLDTKNRFIYIIDNNTLPYHRSSTTFINLFKKSAPVSDMYKVLICSLNTHLHTLGECSNPAITLIEAPRMIIFNATGNVAYISNLGTPSITQCQVNSSTGKLSACKDAGATGIQSPIGLAMHPNNKQWMYIVNRLGPVSLCQINSTTGDLNHCADSGATGLNNPRMMTFNKAGTIAYLTNIKINSVFQCDVNLSSGQLSGCVNSGATGLSRPFGLTLNATETFAYIVNKKSNSISQCTVNKTTGHLSGCVNSGATLLENPEDLIISKTGEAYITTNTKTFGYHYDKSILDYLIRYQTNKTSNIIQCEIEPTTGRLTPCHLLHRDGSSRQFGIQQGP